MSGILVKYLDFGGGDVLPVRAIHLYDPFEYFVHVSGNGRIGAGIVRKGLDSLVPPCEYERDICCYLNGAQFAYNTSCPHIDYAANGQVSISGLAVLYKSSGGGILNAPRGHYVSTTVRSVDKFQGRDYSVYDSQLHRRAGVQGIFNWGDDIPAYETLPHGSVFLFDIDNVLLPSYTAIIAVNNTNVSGIGFRSYNYDPEDYGGLDNSTLNRYIANADSVGYNYYSYRYGTNAVVNRPMNHLIIRSLYKTVSIGGVSHDIFAITFDAPYNGSSSGNMAKYVESPYLCVNRNDTTKVGSLYILDECVTVHKPNS